MPGATSYDLYRGTDRQSYTLVGNERQNVAIRATAGTFKLTFGANQTAALAFDISAADLKTALDGLASITSVSVTKTAVTGGFDYVVTFDGTGLARTDVDALVSDATSLTGGAHTATVTTLTEGGPFDDDVDSPYLDAADADAQFTYALRARNGDGESDPSNIVKVQTGAPADPELDPTGALHLAVRAGLTG